MKWEYKEYPGLKVTILVFSLAPFVIAILTDSINWLLAYGFCVSIYGLFCIAEQLKKTIYQNTVISEQIAQIINKTGGQNG